MSSIAGNTGAFTLGGLLTNSVNLLQVTAATKSDQQTGTSNAVAITPLHQQDHDSAAKGWVSFTGVGGVVATASYNTASVSRSGLGLYVVTWTTPFATANYICSVGLISNGSTALGIFLSAKTTSTIQVNTGNVSWSAAADAQGVDLICSGRQ